MSWRDYASCAEISPEFFFPDSNRAGAEAKKICGSCPVQRKCLTYAIENGETEGIWGGKSPREIQAMRAPRSTAEERVEDVRRLAGDGFSDEEISSRLELHKDSVYRIRRRNQIEGRAA